MKLTIKNKTLDFSRPHVMGILNVTPDSFYDGGAYLHLDLALKRAHEMVAAGATIIDIGGESTRPHATAVSADEQLRRIMPVLEALCEQLDVMISIDTSEAQVIQAVDQAGAHLINDVCALQKPGALQAVANSQMAVCLMHMQGTPRIMQDKPVYQDVVAQVADFLMQRSQVCQQAGIGAERILLDPGFGFGKALAHNCQLLDKLETFCQFGHPVLVGLSRKSMIGQLIDESIENRLHASVAAALLATDKGAHIVRVHDVLETVQALKFYHQWRLTVKHHCQ